MRLQQYLREEYEAILRGAEVFVNPSRKEMRECGKGIRFTAVNGTKKLYVWNADKLIHIEVWGYLMGSDSEFNSKTGSFKILNGEAEFVSGSWVMIDSDSLLYDLEITNDKAKELYTKYKWVSKWIDVKSFLMDADLDDLR